MEDLLGGGWTPSRSGPTSSLPTPSPSEAGPSSCLNNQVAAWRHPCCSQYHHLWQIHHSSNICRFTAWILLLFIPCFVPFHPEYVRQRQSYSTDYKLIFCYVKTIYGQFTFCIIYVFHHWSISVIVFILFHCLGWLGLRLWRWCEHRDWSWQQWQCWQLWQCGHQPSLAIRCLIPGQG